MKKILLTIATVFIFCVYFFVHKADASVATIPFGGYVTYVDYCDDGSTLIYEYDLLYKTVIPLIYSPYLSRLNSFYNVWTPGNKLLGTAFPGGVCVQAERYSYIYGFLISGPFPLFPGVGTSLK